MVEIWKKGSWLPLRPISVCPVKNLWRCLVTDTTKYLGIAYIPVLILFAGVVFRIALPPEWPMFLVGLFVSSSFTSVLIGGLLCLSAAMEQGKDWWYGTNFN